MAQKTEDYYQITKVIQYLVAHHHEQPSLDELAVIAGLSSSHFQRKFSYWVGISPKSFLQALTFSNARELLGKGGSLSDVALDSGLSGASRLHDLCVTLEAASPGEIKEGGKDLTISYGFCFSPFGECFIATSQRGVMQITFTGDLDTRIIIEELLSEWPNAEYEHNDCKVKKIAKQIFKPEQIDLTKPLRAYVKASRFQFQVWRALLEVTQGQMITYGELAKKIGKVKASRAVGSAVASNSLAYLIPCHRVIRASGVIGAYRWGKGRKRLMIAYEQALFNDN